MFYLLANIVFASAFMLSIKWVQNRKREDVIVVGAINYIAAMVLSLPEIWPSISNGESIQEMAPAVITGAVMGGCYFVCFFFVNYSIRWIGAAGSTVIAVLSILLPIICGIFIWGENPNGWQVLGIVIAMVSLTMIGAQRSKQPTGPQPWFTPIILIVFFLLAGTSRLAQEAFKHEGDPLNRPAFLFAAFLVAAVPSLVVILIRRKKVSAMAIVFGTVMGTANLLQTHFILKSLQYLEGFVVFPVTSAGGLMLTTLVATALLGERLTRRSIAGIALATAALFLLHWVPNATTAVSIGMWRP